MHKYDVMQKGPEPESASKALILLHGRGATSGNIMQLEQFFTDETWHVSAPQATGMQWYPYSFMMPAASNEPWLSSAIDYVKSIVDQISVHLPSNNIYIIGFSQGACLAAEYSARYAVRFGGIALFTGGLIGNEPGYHQYKGNFEGTRIYISNGDDDPHIPQQRSGETRDQLFKMGAEVSFEIFPGREHTIIQEEIENARAFILPQKE